jgi:ABC-type sugar transport system, periplasmic component
MRKAIAIALALTLLMAGCGAQVQANATPAATPAVPTATARTADIGFSLAGGDAFRTQLKLDIEAECAGLGYRAEILTAETADAQQEDIASLLALDVSVIVIDPVDVDALETMLAECETQDVRVINIVDSINGAVSMLISPDYIQAGKTAAGYANDLLETGNCLELKTSYDSFVMQLLSDGFEGALDSGISVTEAYCGDDVQAACDAAKEALQAGGAGLIFAQSAALARGALRAIEETGSDVPLIVFGGDMETIASVAAGDIEAAVFFGPAEAAQQAVYYADQMIKNSALEAPQYVELTVEAADADNVSQYQTDSAYAQVKGNNG